MQVSFLFRRARAAFSSGRQLRARPRGDVTSEEPLTGEAQPRRVGRHRDPGVDFSMAFHSFLSIFISGARLPGMRWCGVIIL